MGLVMRIAMSDILQKGTLKNHYVNGKRMGFQFDVCLGYYRGHYLSDIDELAVTIDGTEIPGEDLLFCLRGKEYAPCELKYLISEFWDIRTPAVIQIHSPGGLPEGDHTISLRLMLRSPYLPKPGSDRPHDYVPIDSCDEQILTLGLPGGETNE